MIFSLILEVLQEVLASLVAGSAERQWLISKSSAIEQYRAITSTAGTVRAVSGRVDSGIGAGTFYLQVIDAAALPADGAVTHLVAPIKIVTAVNVDTQFNLDFLPAGIPCVAGAILLISSTQFTKSLVTAGNFLVCTARYD